MLAALVLLLLHPHSAPTMWIDATIESGRVELVVCIRADHADAWLQGGLPSADLVDFITDEERTIALETLTRYFGQHNPLFLNDERVKPVALQVSTPEDAEGRELIDYLAFRFAYPCEGWPTKMTIEWEDFEGANFQGDPLIPCTLRVGPQHETFALAPDMTKFTWVYPESGLPQRAAVEAVPVEAPHGFPWAAHVVLGLAALGGVVGLRRAGAGPASWGLLLLLIGSTAFALPWDPAANPILTRAQARTVFEQLLSNVYRAFEAITEDESYDLLAYSVEPELTEKLYLDIRRGLEMRAQGGAIAEVGQIERRGGTIEFTGAGEFRVHWRWRVFAHITHWGHTHTRINEYVADFVVRAGPHGWRIAAFDLSDMQRIPTEDDPR